MDRIYFDNNATTPLDPSAFQAMRLELEGPPANPSSIHWFGQRAKNLLANARQGLASFFQVQPEEVFFTSGGTEALNFLLRGLKKTGHVVTSPIEHSSIYKTSQTLEREGLSVTYLPIDFLGSPAPSHVKEAIRSDTQAIILSAANGETGVKSQLEAIAAIAEKRGIPLFVDAVALAGKEPLPSHPGITAMVVSGHKFHGPKGSGALFLRSHLSLPPLLTGGPQEHQRRAGTENLSAILGLAEATRIALENQEAITQHLLELRNSFEEGLKQEISDLMINGEGPRVANTSNIAFPGVDGETLLIYLDQAGIAASHGSACSSGALEPSRVLLNMGIDGKRARSSLRFSFSRRNTKAEVEKGISVVAHLVKKLREVIPPSIE